MSHDLLDIVNAADGPLDLVVFAATASPEVRASAQVLAVTLSSSPTRLTELISETWPDLAERSASAVETLSTWPFVAASRETDWRIYPGAAESLKNEFREADARAFVALHDRLAVLEDEVAVQEEIAQSRWHARARAAYYRSAVNADDAADRFGESFVTSPPLERSRARAWLGQLVARQRSLLSDQERVVTFFEAFSRYRHERSRAKPLLETVLASDATDVYQAVALHLYGVIISANNRGEAIAAFRRSVTMSSEVGVPDNEIMARNSLVWAILATTPKTQDARESAFALAEENVARAEAIGENSMIASLRFTAAAIEWVVLTEGNSSVSRRAREAAPRIAAALDAIADSSRAAGDISGAVRALNELASVKRDVGELENSLATLDGARDWLATLSWLPSEGVSRLAKTARSVRGRALSADTRKRASLLSEAFEALLATDPNQGHEGSSQAES